MKVRSSVVAKQGNEGGGEQRLPLQPFGDIKIFISVFAGWRVCQS